MRTEPLTWEAAGSTPPRPTWSAVGEPDVQTTVNLVVGGTVVRTATGMNSERLGWASWDVTDLIGQSAQVRIIDNNTTGWGHILADQFSFDDRPAA
ncbi:MAG TPA: hypothetical protein VGU71_03635 [Candidatus Dormibacteraeota bacterium]|nr:hypothetical protein [Candidatus Dormibacteraeota bacterium]